MDDDERDRPLEKRQVEGQWSGGNIYLTLRKATNKYQKLITEKGLAKTDFTRSTASTHSLQMVLESKWVREEVIGLTQTIPIFTSFGPSSQTHRFTEKNTRHFTLRIISVFEHSQTRLCRAYQAAGI